MTETTTTATTERPTRLTREQSRAQTRERLLASAAVVFGREGYGGASVDRIAEEAGYSKGALYSNFASKDELFGAMFTHYAGGEVQALCRRLDTVDDAGDIIATVSDWANAMRHEPDLRLLVQDMVRHVRGDPALAARHALLFDEQWKAIGTRLLKMFPAGQYPVTPVELGALVMSLAYANGVRLHAAVRTGNLIGIALRALNDAYGEQGTQAEGTGT